MYHTKYQPVTAWFTLVLAATILYYIIILIKIRYSIYYVLHHILYYVYKPYSTDNILCFGSKSMSTSKS